MCLNEKKPSERPVGLNAVVLTSVDTLKRDFLYHSRSLTSL